MRAKVLDIKLLSEGGRLYVEAENIIKSEKGRELISRIKNSSLYREIVDNKKTKR